MYVSNDYWLKGSGPPRSDKLMHFVAFNEVDWRLCETVIRLSRSRIVQPSVFTSVFGLALQIITYLKDC